ncbi:MAG: exodeoxyribonuclease V subunit gamma [Elusimicrobiaceae bacterium]|nr:exodeoxyribonuclease V subunit gamma [Elusimicrobiaceae bacterium]
MKLFYAPLRALEQKFIEYILNLQIGPEQGGLVLCPSQRVASYLQGLLLKHKPVIGNLAFKTIGQLMKELDQENIPNRKPLLPADQLQDYLLKKLLLRPDLNRYPPTPGIISALKSSLRDLADALVEPEVLYEHWLSLPEFSLMEEQAHLKWLLDIYRAYLGEMDKISNYRSYAQYFSQVLRAAENSAYLKGFKQIIVYGFYEFTGRQLELFNVLRRNYALSVFWVYAQHPAFAYGKKFFESNLLGLAQTVEEVNENWAELACNSAAEYLFSGRETEKTVENMQIVSSPDLEGELFFVAKEMLRLHEEEGIRYEDMAVTARSLDPYKNLLPAVFKQNLIPLNASFSQPVSAYPLGVFLHNLLNLSRSGFGREEVLSVVQSPYFKQKNNWRYLVFECQAQRDFSQWADLLRPSLPHYDASFLKWLEQTKANLEFLETSLDWELLCKHVQTFLEKNIDFSSFSAQEHLIWRQWEQGLKSLLRFSCVSKQADKNEFLDELMSMFKQLGIHEVIQTSGGATVVDVMNLRGLSFKVLFVLGLNEKKFPQVLREDPMLKDYYRRILRDQLGYWINQKMERFDEERLLFFCTIEAAKQKIYFSYLRSDQDGKPMIVSGYLAEIGRLLQIPLESEKIKFITARKTQRLKQVNPTFLTQKEVTLLLATQNATSEEYEQTGLLSKELENCLFAARQVAGIGAGNAYDGLVKSGADIFQAQNTAGFSPSALKDLALCPMKYFFNKGLGLREREDVFSRSELAANLRGDIYHESLMDYYTLLNQQGLTGQLFETALKERVCQSLQNHYDKNSYKWFGIYPVIWDLILTDIQEKLACFVVKDAEYLKGFVPQIFETSFEKIYAPSPQLRLKLKGTVDRIDIDWKNKRFRVLDYKSSLSGKKGLAEIMFKQVILQPFIYLILASEQPQTKGLQKDGAALLGINKGYARQELSQSDFENISSKAADFFSLLMKLIVSSCFFINPSDHCQYCAYQAICRKDNFRSLLRSRHTKEFHLLQEAKQ